MWYGLIGAVVGFVLGTYLARSMKSGPVQSENKDRLRIKNEKLELLRAFIQGKKEITNKDVEDFLEMSDATATRYLDELEKEGKVEQIGKVGASVKYKVR